MKKIRAIFITWWLLAVICPFIIIHKNFQYDADGAEGVFWWFTFLIGFPFVMFGEIAGEFLSNVSEPIQIAVTLIFGSMFIYFLYCLIFWIFVRRKTSA